MVITPSNVTERNSVRPRPEQELRLKTWVRAKPKDRVTTVAWESPRVVSPQPPHLSR